MKKIVCVRHGRTAWNAVGRFQGLVDNPLDEVGHEQVRATAALLRAETFDYAVSSGLTRTRQTMEIVLEGRAVLPEVDPGWRERDFGAWEGLTWAEITERSPELAAAVAIDVRNFQPEGGELFDDVKARVAGAYERALEKIDDGATALVVAHAGVLHALLDVLFGPERKASMIPPAGILVLQISTEGIALI